MEPDIRQVRHDLLGTLNALKLCVTAFHLLKTKEERLDFLAMIESAAEKTTAALDTLEESLDHQQPTTVT